jgi:arginine decarboxylase
MKVSITLGRAEGPSKLNSFDNALLSAGIGDVNLIKVSSILPSSTKIVELPDLEKGSMVNCVLSSIYSENRGEVIHAAIAVAMCEDMGCVVEHSGVGKDPDKIKTEAENMAKYMMDIRGLKIQKTISKVITHEVKEKGSAIAALIYLEGVV